MPTQAPERASRKEWIAVAAALLGAFMAILDVSITNSSLQDIQGGLGATLDEGAWISTAYLVAEIIVIPLTGFFTSVFSLRRYLTWNTAIFILASVLCGTARSLPAMIAFRAIQGFSGGILIPTATSIILTKLPRAQQSVGLALFGIAATFAPCIGPTVGGWLTVNYSWPYIFFINLVPGAILLVLIRYAIEETPMRLEKLRGADWPGIAAIAVALGCFTVVLEEGVRKDWFGSSLIVTLSGLSVVAFLFFLYVELRAERPFINLRLLGRKNFLISTILTAIFGFGLYGSIYILPYFLASVQRLNAQQIGNIVMWQGLPQLLVLPFIPTLMKRFDARVLLGIGLLFFGSSALMNSALTRDWAKDQFLWSQILRALGQPFIITPLSAIAYFGIETSELGSASGLNNMMRNLGGSIGIGTLGAVLDHQYHLHFTRLAEATTIYSTSVQSRLHFRATFIGARYPLAGLRSTLATIYGSLTKEAFVMSFGDCFLVIALLFFAGAALVVLARRPSGVSAPGAH